MDNKQKQLGMPFGTASGRLKKLIMFHLVQQLKQDICFKCGTKIETAEELTLDHKVNWLHNNTELFWDVHNVAFSHRKCNRPERYYVGPEVGMYRKLDYGAIKELMDKGYGSRKIAKILNEKRNSIKYAIRSIKGIKRKRL